MIHLFKTRTPGYLKANGRKWKKIFLSELTQTEDVKQGMYLLKHKRILAVK